MPTHATKEKTLPESPPRNLTWLGVIALVALVTASSFLVRKADSAKPADWSEDQLTYLPSGKLLKPMAMDLDEAVADLLWIRGMIYFADAYLENKSYRWLGHILDIVTLLNPHFKPAYEFGGVVLTKGKQEIPKTLRLLERGIEHFPNDWKLRLFAATARISLDSDYVQAAEYLKPITLDKDVPDHIRTLCASMLSKGGGRKVALAFLVDRFTHSRNSIHKEIFVGKILKLYPEAHPDSPEVRKKTVAKILHEVVVEPRVEMMALGLLHEYLQGIPMSPGNLRLMELLK